MSIEYDNTDSSDLLKYVRRARPEYLTVEECRIICRFKTASAIRKAVYRGELKGTRVRYNKLLIQSKSFWAWFHKNDVRPKSVVHIDLHEPVVKPSTEPEGEEEEYAIDRFE